MRNKWKAEPAVTNKKRETHDLLRTRKDPQKMHLKDLLREMQAQETRRRPRHSTTKDHPKSNLKMKNVLLERAAIILNQLDSRKTPGRVLMTETILEGIEPTQRSRATMSMKNLLTLRTEMMDLQYNC